MRLSAIVNIGILLTKAASTYRHRTALAYRSSELTYEEFNSRSEALGSALRRLGLRKGDRVAILQHNCPQFLESLYASFKAGLVVVPLNVRLHPNELAYIIGHSETKAVMFSEEFKETLDSVSKAVDLGNTTLVCVSNPAKGMLDYEKLVGEGRTERPMEEASLDDIAWLFYTSGTTGRPKGAMLTHRNLLSMTMNFLADVYAPTTDDRALHQAPLAHGSGLYSIPLTARGALSIISASKSFDPPSLLSTIQEKKVTVIPFLTPTMIKMLLIYPQNSEYDASSLKCVVYGGSPMYEEDLKAAIVRFGPVFAQIYGQGEAPMTITYLPKEWHMGNAANPGAKTLISAGIARTDVRVKIFDENDTELSPGSMGEIVVEGDVVMKGYWKDPKATSETLRGGWLHTGDLGYLDEDGYLFIMDRKKDLIKSGGSNIYPREVEEALLRHPAVQEVAVFGVPDQVWGESVKAMVVRKPGSQASEAELIEFCKQQIASYKKPKSVEFIDSIPKNAFGKVLKRELRDKYWAGLAKKV
jgi:acyl-CoA synthetase (AMP-forming)/AMP-acid ligase II